MKLSAGTHFNLKRGEIKVFYAEVTLENDDTIRGLFNAPGKVECISVEGQNYLGEWFDKLDKIAKAGVPKKLWFYVKAPDAPGSYKGVIEIINTARKLLDRAVITYDVSEEIAEENQFKNPEELTRLFWINSKLGIDNEVTSPYTPVEFDGGVAKILGRELVFNSFALPEKITTHFDENGKICDESWEILSDKIAFSIGGESFKNVAFGKELFPDSIRLSSVNENDNFIIKISTRLEFDGHITTKLFIAAKRDAKLSDVNISLPISEYASKYFMGLGNKGGAFNKALDWKWDSAKNQDSFWVGNVNAGIRVKFYGENYEKPLTANHYSKKPLELPVAWNNGGRGGVRYEDGSFIIYSGERELKYSEKLSFNLDFTVTPIKPQAAEKGEYTLIKKGEAGNSLPNAPILSQELRISKLKSLII